MQFGMNEIFAVIDKVKDAQLTVFEYEDGDGRLKLCAWQEDDGKERKKEERCHVSAVLEKETVSEHKEKEHICSEANKENDGMLVLSTMVGTFYSAASEGENPFVKIGEKVEKGQTLGIIEAMKLMNEVESPCSGRIVEVLAKNEQMVEFGQPLFRIEEEVKC